MDLESLSVASALVSPFPTWEVEAADESGLLSTLDQLGPFPQADIFEPWEPDAAWRARVVYPDLDSAQALLSRGRLEAGQAPGLLEWLDRGRIGIDVVETALGPSAVCLSDLEQGGLLIPDLVPADGPWMHALRSPVVEALGGGSAHRVSGVIHRSTGRLGLLVEVAVQDQEPLEERRQAVHAVASVVTQLVKAEHAQLRLAPDLRWWFDMGRVFVLAWAISECGPGLPGDRFDASKPVDLSNEPGDVEVQVVFDSAAHDRLAIALSEKLGPFGLRGARPRWTHLDGERVFLACWEGEFSVDLAPVLELAGASKVRVVPGCPPGLEADWVGIDPAWFAVGHRLLVRWHCALQDRDLLPVCDPRAADSVDEALIAALSALGPAEPVWAGRGALRLRFPSLAGPAWWALAEVLGSLPDSRIAPVVHVRLAGQLTVLLYRVDLAADGVPRWQA